ncbi:MAG: DUF4157 domain-containing protein [Hungatella hathewayi]|nr:DUF4157 domain-containing protein [Hungatella hathewayi]
MENRGKKAEPKKKSPTIKAVQKKSAPNMTGIPDDMKTRYETISGLSMDDVKVHYNSSKPATVQALAYTQGTNIYMGAGQERHLGHELWHVVQQKQGRVQPTGSVGGMPLNDSASLEREADLMG